MTQKAVSFNDFVIVTVGRNDYRIIFYFMTKNQPIDRIKNVDLSEKSGRL